MKRRPWLTLVILVLVGISATMLVGARRGARMGDDIAVAFAFDDDALPCTPLRLEAAPVRTATVVDAAVPASHVLDTCVITIAPKTSPPR